MAFPKPISPYLSIFLYKYHPIIILMTGNGRELFSIFFCLFPFRFYCHVKNVLIIQILLILTIAYNRENLKTLQQCELIKSMII
jgi:hypothetical protein